MKFGPSGIQSRRGVAIVIVLGFIVLLTGIVVALFVRSISAVKISESNAEQIKANLFAQGALKVIVGDLSQEIVDGSNILKDSGGAAILDENGMKSYLPKTSSNTVPQRAGTADTLPNLVKLSASGVKAYTMGSVDGPARASSILTTEESTNGRSFSASRWNKGFLLPKKTPTSNTDATPINDFVVPNWIYVAKDGSNPTAWVPSLAAKSSNPVLGRYAYAVYDEGGLLDANVAGYPTGSNGATAGQIGSKAALSYADLSMIFVTAGFSQSRAEEIVNQMVAWRNYASLQPSGSFPTFGFGSGTGGRYFDYVTSNLKGFLGVGNTTLVDGQSDRQFSSRQELMKFLLQGVAADSSERAKMQAALQYLATFTRDINQPAYIPAVQTDSTAPVVLAASLGGNSAIGGDKLINPSFPNIRVQASFTRNDGSTAKVGEPLVNKRFALNRLAWITYKGPSAVRSQSDPDIQSLINNGIPWTYLQLGTAANIQKYFGLTWDSSNDRWKYSVHNGGGTGKGLIMNVGRTTSTVANASKYVQDANRDPDFFELLKAGITVGSLGKAATTSSFTLIGAAVPSAYGPAQVPANMRYAFDSSVDYHVIQIGANILSEVNPTSYPVRITFDDGSARGAWEFQGVTDLPYLNYVFNGVIREKLPIPAHPVGGNQGVDGSPHQAPTAQVVNPSATPPVPALTDPGNAYLVQVPAVWNPYDPNGTPGVLRPAKFRVVIDSSDPLSPSGSGNLQICCFAAGSKTTAAGSAATDGTGPPNAKYSIDSDVTVGKSPGNINGGLGTAIHDAVTFDDSSGALYREPTLIFATSAPGNATRVSALSGATPAGNIKSIDANPLVGSSIPAGTDLAPLVLGTMPLAFSFGTAPITNVYSSTGYIALAAGNGDNRVYFTYRLQYQDPSGNWVTYDTKYGRTSHGLFGFQNSWHSSPGFSPSVVKGPDFYNAYSWASAIDPRTARFGLIMDLYNEGKSRSPIGKAPADTGWIFDSNGTTTAVGITYPIRQDNSAGYGFANLDSDRTTMPPGGRGSSGSAGDNTIRGQTLLGMVSRDVPYPSFSAGWTVPVVLDNNGGRLLDIYMFAPGMYAQNNPSAPFYLQNGGDTNISPSYYADADGVVRRAASAYVPFGVNASASTPVGLPTASINGYTGKPASLVTPANATPFTQSQSRPLLLHRPFRSVAELGYVFRDLPWKNLDFFTPESGDAALLDVFCINETSDPKGLVAGKVNLNTRQAPVLAAIVSGACVDDPKITNTTVGSLSATIANTIGSGLVARTADTANYGPLQNVSEVVGKWKSAVGATGPAYSPTNPGNNWGSDLPLASGYKDGQKSYTGFSGTATGITTGKDLNVIFTPVSAGTITESLAYVKRLREAPIRALANVGQTRVWNLMIDVVAQTGRCNQSSLAQFVVEGEQRFWVHVAIDRLTGQVIDQQVEVVKE